MSDSDDSKVHVGNFMSSTFDSCKVDVHVTHIARNYGPVYQAAVGGECECEDVHMFEDSDDESETASDTASSDSESSEEDGEEEEACEEEEEDSEEEDDEEDESDESDEDIF